MTPLTGNRELALASWRLLETLGAPAAESYIAAQLQRAVETQTPSEVLVWRMVANAVRRLAEETRQSGTTLH